MKSSNPKNNNPSGHPETLTPYKPKWNLGKTKTIRVPIAIADELLDIARTIDEGKSAGTIDKGKSAVSEAETILLEALKLKANAGGAIKKEIRKSLELLNG